MTREISTSFALKNSKAKKLAALPQLGQAFS